MNKPPLVRCPCADCKNYWGLKEGAQGRQIEDLKAEVRGITPDGPAGERFKQVLVKILELLKEGN